MAGAATTEEKRPSWWPVFWGLAGLLLLPFLPFFNVVIPIQQTLLLFIPAVAVCALLGWKSGSRAALAIIWLALAVWILLQPAGVAGTPYDQMARAWAILLSASFGLVSLWSAATPFFVRALAAVGLSLATGFVIALSSPSGMARFQHAAGDDLTRRASVMVASMQESWQTPQWKDLAGRFPLLESSNEASADVIREAPKHTAPLFPAVLALESIVVLALAWAVYHRLSPVRIGPPLGPLNEFRFNDQLIWGLAVGLTLCLLPAFGEGRSAGLNLLFFFGGLFLLRGLGVLVWISKGRYAFMVVLSLIPQGLALLGLLALALGLGDTWLDLRRRARAS
jgi:hypothetical protein